MPFTIGSLGLLSFCFHGVAALSIAEAYIKTVPQDASCGTVA